MKEILNELLKAQLNWPTAGEGFQGHTDPSLYTMQRPGNIQIQAFQVLLRLHVAHRNCNLTIHFPAADGEFLPLPRLLERSWGSDASLDEPLQARHHLPEDGRVMEEEPLSSWLAAKNPH